MPDYSKNIVYLSQAQYQELITNQTITVDGVTVTYDENDIYVTPQAEPVTDVRVAGASVTANGVANIPVANTNTYGIVMLGDSFGNNANNKVILSRASDIQVRIGSNYLNAIVPLTQHAATFYGLSKAAGVDLGSETTTIGIYPDSSKAAI